MLKHSQYTSVAVLLFYLGNIQSGRDEPCGLSDQADWRCHYLGSCPVILQMNLARHSISATEPLVLYDVRFDADCQIFTASSPEGFAVYRVLPLDLLKKRGKYRLTIAPDYG